MMESREEFRGNWIRTQMMLDHFGDSTYNDTLAWHLDGVAAILQCLSA